MSPSAGTNITGAFPTLQHERSLSSRWIHTTTHQRIKKYVYDSDWLAKSAGKAGSDRGVRRSDPAGLGRWGGGGRGGGGNSPPAPPPSVTISVSPTTITVGQSAVLTWSSTQAASCTASGSGWSGNQQLAGTVTETPTKGG